MTATGGMTRIVSILALTVMVLLPVAGEAQVFDLAGSAAPAPLTVMSGKAPDVTLINRVPGQEYKWLVVVETRTIPPIDLPAGIPKPLIESDARCAEEPLKGWLDVLRTADDEKTVAEAVSATKVDELRKKYSDACWNAIVQKKVAEAIASTRLEIDLSGHTLALEENQQLILTVTRVAGSSVKIWTFVLRTAEAGNWLTTWGFGFANDRDDRYFQQPLADGTFRITRERAADRTDLTFIPGVFFHWMPRKDETRDWSFSPFTAGIGLSKEAPAVMLGVSVTRRRNVSVIVGGAMSRARRLDGIYEPDQILKERTADDKLFENTYRPNVFFSLAIRFDKNPFSD